MPLCRYVLKIINNDYNSINRFRRIKLNEKDTNLIIIAINDSIFSRM